MRSASQLIANVAANERVDGALADDELVALRPILYDDTWFHRRAIGT